MSSVTKRMRQSSALDRLKNQLEVGIKINKEGKEVPLTDKDRKRINGEVETLRKRV